jgi:hypothetical protein
MELQINAPRVSESNEKVGEISHLVNRDLDLMD